MNKHDFDKEVDLIVKQTKFNGYENNLILYLVNKIKIVRNT